ncbi:MAG TPA: hypothetical protein VGR87_14960 [Candidatus Limnocylindria bacterium]|jgi:hypothetical protein|nr:hypothetical protein [Candidatus Limnocylindria bacterium]
MGGSFDEGGRSDFDFAMGIVLMAIALIAAVVLLHGQIASLLNRG